MPFFLDTKRSNGVTQVDALAAGPVLPTRVGETLADASSTGRRRPWAERKRESRAVDASLIRVGKADGDEGCEKAGSRVWACADDLTFRIEADPETGEVVQRLDGVHFCRDRLCPLCQWRKSLVTASTLSRCLGWVDAEHPGLVPIFLTLTVRNCSSGELGGTIHALTDGWGRMVKDRRMRGRIAGYFRSVEVTYAAQADTWHPHIHAVLLVDAAYFSDPSLYMDQAAWVTAWRRFARLDYDPPPWSLVTRASRLGVVWRGREAPSKHAKRASMRRRAGSRSRFGWATAWRGEGAGRGGIPHRRPLRRGGRAR